VEQYSTKGIHCVADFWGVDFNLLNNEKLLQEELQKAAIKCGATVLKVISHEFQPNGVTVLVMLSESHITIHTYPDKGFAGIDCYTCGSPNPSVAIDYLVEVLKPKKVNSRLITRGDGVLKTETGECWKCNTMKVLMARISRFLKLK
jgi:S-adenosylmethionine decarboxylase